MAAFFWNNPADDYTGASNHVELTGPDDHGNEWTMGLAGRPHDAEPPQPQVGDVGLNRKI